MVESFDESTSFVSSDDVGNFVVTWTDVSRDGDNDGAFAQRFGGLWPAALAVDPTGNGVLQPNETKEVRPSWRNRNGAALPFGGTLGSIVGPAGPTYVILDGVADYGTVANGATGACTNCYSVLIAAGSRPVQHWDVTVIESITPDDTLGQQKRWLLHVGESFVDIPTSSPFFPFIENLFHNSVTGGCTANAYCPASVTTRDQMAVFVLVAKEGPGYAPPACTTPLFADVAGGCGGNNYCPGQFVTRDQMAVFVLRTLDPTLNPPACSPPNIFGDVPETSPFCRWVEELSRRGVVSGCGAGNYCPGSPVTREQMSVFLVATFGLTLYGT